MSNYKGVAIDDAAAIGAVAATSFSKSAANTALTTAGAGTLTAAALAGGLITRTGPAGAFNDTTDTAANILGAMSQMGAGQGFNCVIQNSSAFTETLVAGTGVTLAGTTTVAAGQTLQLLVLCTAAGGPGVVPAVTITGYGAAIGSAQSLAGTTGASNTLYGTGAGGAVTTGTGLTLVGVNAGNTVTSGSNVTCLGSGAQASSATATNEVDIGNTSVATIRAQVTSITGYSDARDKRNVSNLPPALPILADLRPVSFNWDMRSWYEGGEPDGTKVTPYKEVGFIAQEALAVVQKHGIHDLRVVDSENPDQLSMTYGRLIPLLVQGINELSAQVTALRGTPKTS